MPVSPLLRALLDEYVPLAYLDPHGESPLGIHRGARFSPKFGKLMKHRISFFSGIDFNVDPAKGLNGTCDFILAASPIQLFLRSPVLMIVEAKNDNIKSGLGQCAAEMVAARVFNEREGDGATIDPRRGHDGEHLAIPQAGRRHDFHRPPEYYLDRSERSWDILALRRRRPGDGGRGRLNSAMRVNVDRVGRATSR